MATGFHESWVREKTGPRGWLGRHRDVSSAPLHTAEEHAGHGGRAGEAILGWILTPIVLGVHFVLYALAVLGTALLPGLLLLLLVPAVVVFDLLILTAGLVVAPFPFP